MQNFYVNQFYIVINNMVYCNNSEVNAELTHLMTRLLEQYSTQLYSPVSNKPKLVLGTRFTSSGSLFSNGTCTSVSVLAHCVVLTTKMRTKLSCP